MDERYKSTPADDALVSDRSAGVVDRVSALSRLAVDKLTRLEPEVAAQLDDPSGMVRGEALLTLLGGWELGGYLDTALEMLRADPDDDARMHAVRGLSSFVTYRRDPAAVERPAQREVILAALVEAFLHDPSPSIQLFAYSAVYEMLTGSSPALPDAFDREVDADWELLAPYLPPAERRPPRPRPPRVASEQDVALLSDPGASPEALVAAIDRVETDRRYDLVWPVTRLRGHPSPVVRGRALLALARTWRDADIEWTEETLRSDPAWEARAAAAETVPYMLQPYPGFRPNARQMLTKALKREKDERVRVAIRQAVERVDDPAFPPPPS